MKGEAGEGEILKALECPLVGVAASEQPPDMLATQQCPSRLQKVYLLQ